VDKASFKLYVDKLGYDKYYQDIEYLDFVGYSLSYKTWSNIKDIFAWRGKRVADLGCFHGYFSFKIAKEGASVVGFDRAQEVLDTTSILNNVYGNLIELRRWEGGQVIPSDFDIALCLNVLHHFDDPELSLLNIRSKYCLFEINQVNTDIVERYFEIVEARNSHRPGRIIALGERHERIREEDLQRRGATNTGSLS
jgi:SAM-dependent methyltransferase